ncbi:hypothetical protein NV379_01430 [Paenibacillus sp. N1-5-1-14]|uniref:hypothetical protein n=1 Tax=Paenibacillus radicibacter TaxID=2972488 RepID=UPI002159B53C|nr:hypothetical protein [Paenibacillus radicibacter]MCR8641305.1 hypothetical protein [Paenibacillus radicibacter]
MAVELLGIHWLYVVFIVLIIGCMVMRKDTTLVCIIGIFLIGLLATESLSQSVSGVFNSFIYAIKELLGTILVISLIVAMSNVLTKTGINEMMIAPVARFIRTPALAYWIIGLIMLVISLFFWPSPAVALIGAVLLPVALRVGLPAIGVAIAMNLFGHGIALSGDYIIQGAPKLTAGAAGIPIGDVMQASIPLVIVMGVVTTVTAFWFLHRDMKKGKLGPDLSALLSRINVESAPYISDEKRYGISRNLRRFLAILVVLLFAADVYAMYTLNLQGGDATALIGGTCVFIMGLVTMLAHKKDGLERVTGYILEGLQFGFKVFGPVIPIAAFFYLGDSALIDIFGKILPATSHGIVNDLGLALAQSVPTNASVSALTLTSVGAITGLDGSGFSGISLAGSVAHLFGVALGKGIATLTALGQISAIWVGGGTLIPWALIPAAAICGVSPFELARRNLKPVVIGLVVTTIVAAFLL